MRVNQIKQAFTCCIFLLLHEVTARQRRTELNVGGPIQRGGGSSEDDDDAALDAYIEQLIASVKDEEIETQNNNTLWQNHLDQATIDTKQDSQQQQQPQEEEEVDAPTLTSAVAKQKKKRKKQQLPTKNLEKTTKRPNNSSNPTRRKPIHPWTRFLLNQGSWGHILLMVTLMLSEWLQYYIPWFAELINYTTARMVVPQRPPPRRTKTSQRHADQRALQLLKEQPSAARVKYRHVSRDFIARHGLGQKSTTPETIVPATVSTEPEQQEQDWVTEALTKPSKQSKTTLANGLSMEWSFHAGSAEKPRKTANNNIMSWTNTRMSRNLLGAYPGDAWTIEQAASRDGLEALASKYGYGEWSEDDAPHGKKARRKRRQKQVDDELGMMSPMIGTSRRSTSATSPRWNTRRTDPPLAKSLSRTKSALRSNRTQSRVRPIRPATQALEEVKQRRKRKDNDE